MTSPGQTLDPTRRYQNSSCLRCRTHKKKCDARQRFASGHDRCTRCEKHGHQCKKITDPEDSTSPSSKSHDEETKIIKDDSTPIGFKFRASIFVPAWPRTDPLARKQDPLPTTSSFCGPEEAEVLLTEFVDVPWVQLPVLDMDMTYLRYRFGCPTPLPRYLLDVIIAVAGLYNARRLFGSLITIPEALSRYEIAKKGAMEVIYNDATIEGIQVLMILAFHFPGDYGSYERQMMTGMATTKIRLLKLHEDGGYPYSSSREKGVLRILTWLNYVNNVFSPEGPTCSLSMTIPLPVDADWEFIACELLSGRRRTLFGDTEAGFLTLIMTCMSLLGPIADRSRHASGDDIAENQGVIEDLQKWTTKAFPALDLRMNSLLDIIGGPEQALVIVNFAYLHILNTSQFRICQHHRHSNDLPVHEQEKLARGCLKTIESAVGLFEQLWALRRLMNTSQNVRHQVYFAGSCLQTLAAQFGNLVEAGLVERWEKCYEAAEAVWGVTSIR